MRRDRTTGKGGDVSAIRWKFTAGCALFALVGAGLSSLIGGNPAGTTIVRALLAAALFGAAGTAARMAVASFLPELEQLLVASGHGEPEEFVDEPAGTGVDIVVDDDEGEPLIGFVSDDEGEPVAELSGEDDEFADGEDVVTSRAHDVPSLRGDDLVAEAVPIEATESDHRDPTDSIDPSGVDRLPDVGGFADSFDVPETVTTGEGTGSRGGSSDHDPAVMARALQTMLKRDA